MTIAVYRGRKATKQEQRQAYINSDLVVTMIYFMASPKFAP